MSKKFSSEFERDYKFYYDNRITFNFSGSDTKTDFRIQLPGEQGEFAIPYSPEGKPAKICFHKLDGAGKRTPCSEPQLLIEILRCKASVNLNIKMWAESLAEGTLFLPEIQEYMEHFNCPEWVFKSIKNQADRIVIWKTKNHSIQE